MNDVYSRNLTTDASRLAHRSWIMNLINLIEKVKNVSRATLIFRTILGFCMLVMLAPFFVALSAVIGGYMPSIAMVIILVIIEVVAGFWWAKLPSLFDW